MIELVLVALLKANLAAAAAVLSLMALRRPVRRAFGARVAYGLWIAVPLAAAASLLPHPAAPIIPAPVALTATAEVFEAVPAQLPAYDLLPAAAFAIWLAGALALAGVLARRQAAFMAEVRRGRGGPAVVGVLAPRIVTPADFASRFGPQEREVILSHEATHLARGDAGVNAASAALTCVCWFNPLVHVAARLSRMDQELACDATVLARHPHARRVYAEALLKTQLTAQSVPLGCCWPPAAEHPLKERIAMLKSPLPARRRRIVGLGVVAAAGAAAAFAAWAAQPGGLEPDAAQKLVRPGQEVECKPDARRELHDCKVVATPWAKVATAADVARAYPLAARARGLTADVFLQCAVDRTRGALAGCAAKKVYAEKPLPAGAEAAFERAAVEVAAIYRVKPDAAMPSPMFMTIQFRPDPAMPGGPVTRPLPKKAPPDLPMPASAAEPTVAKALWAAGERPAGAPAEPLIAQPDWVRRPGPEDVAGAYPPEALRSGLAGGATIACEVSAAGLLEKCAVAREEPEGAGFGQAALAMSGKFQMKPQTRDGLPVAGGRVRIPIRFMIPTAN